MMAQNDNNQPVVLKLNNQFVERGKVVPGLGDEQLPVWRHVHGLGLQVLQGIKNLFRREGFLDKGLGAQIEGFPDDRFLPDRRADNNL